MLALRRAAWVVSAAWIAGCEPMPASDNLFAPVRESSPASAVGTADGAAAPGTEAGGFDFEGEDRPKEDTDAPAAAAPAAQDETPLTPSEMMQGMGIGPGTPGGDAVAAPAAVLSTGFSSGFSTGSWGVRLLSTVADAQPPRAILGFADGTETVVTPGTMLPSAHVLVLAIGRDAIQIADVTPEGDHARVQTQTLTALVPNK